MLEIHCSGSPFEIGHQHGSAAKAKVAGSLAFYKELFQSKCNLGWPDVCKEASRYISALETLCPRHLEEMRGVAEGAGVDVLDIVALNVRTEIMFGLFTEDPKLDIPMDGCTSLASIDGDGRSFLTQNWDWQREQLPNLFICHVSQPGTDLPDFFMVTEAGIIGKIGFNNRGVGVCLNAIRARGVDPLRLPVHLALRAVLESSSRQAAIDLLKKTGVAGSAHMLIADPSGSTGLECTSKTVMELQMDDRSQVIHSNHLLLEHPDVDEPPWLEDSPHRVPRIRKLFDQQFSSLPVDALGLFELYKDEEGYPGSINRCQIDGEETETLFNIIMDLSEKKAMVTFGRTTAHTERVELVF